jgi:hypothetical protein
MRRPLARNEGVDNTHRIVPLVRIAFLAICAVGVVVASTAGANDDVQQVSGTYGTLNVREHFDPEGGIPTEGYVSYVTVRRAGSGRVVLRAQPPFMGTLHQGRYRVSSYMRTRSGNCGILDPASNGCSTSLRLEGGAATTITVLRRADRPCELRVR